MNDGQLVHVNVTVNYIRLELLPNRMLYEYIMSDGGLPPPICRYFFKELLTGINSIHTAGWAHRDLKLDNIGLDQDYNPKIIDLGLA